MAIRVIPLGGLGEVGMNCMAIEAGEGAAASIVVVDCGVTFPHERDGVDVIHPDLTYLERNADRITGVVVTHGHEDHIGALPYILRELNVPVYGTRFTLALVHKRLEEHGLLDKTDLREVIPGRKVEIGPFEVEFISVTHSTIDCVALAIRTPVGIVIHTGDFKMDPTPI
ncbi:MAG: MBL fold metallo-hydrolase, partial [Polyangiales bacterium]